MLRVPLGGILAKAFGEVVESKRKRRRRRRERREEEEEDGGEVGDVEDDIVVVVDAKLGFGQEVGVCFVFAFVYIVF